MPRHDVLKHVLKKLKEISNVKAVILFGSYARKKQKPYSDIDVAVVLHPIDEKSEIETATLSSPFVDISLFHKLNPAMQFEIITKGKPLFVRSKEFFKEIKISTMNRFFDHIPLYKRFGML